MDFVTHYIPIQCIWKYYSFSIQIAYGKISFRPFIGMCALCSHLTNLFLAKSRPPHDKAHFHTQKGTDCDFPLNGRNDRVQYHRRQIKKWHFGQSQIPKLEHVVIQLSLDTWEPWLGCCSLLRIVCQRNNLNERPNPNSGQFQEQNQRSKFSPLETVGSISDLIYQADTSRDHENNNEVMNRSLIRLVLSLFRFPNANPVQPGRVVDLSRRYSTRLDGAVSWHDSLMIRVDKKRAA